MEPRSYNEVPRDRTIYFVILGYNGSSFRWSLPPILGCIPKQPSNGSHHKIWSARARQFPIPQYKITALYTNIENPIPTLQTSRSSLRSQQNFRSHSRNQHNLVHINCSSVLAVNECNQSKPMSLSVVNICSVKSKSAYFLEFVLASQADIVTLVETWLTPDDVAARKEAVPNRYMLMDQPRIGRKGGGIAILYRKNISVKKVRSGEFNRLL